MRIGLLGGLSLEHDGDELVVPGAMQQAVLVRLALDAGRVVRYADLVDDVWGLDAPENGRAALQSVVSRLRAQLPADLLVSAPGGYRLRVEPLDVDVLALGRRIAEILDAADVAAARALLRDWPGEPWLPSEQFDWIARDLRRDHGALVALARAASTPPPGGAAAGTPRPGGAAGGTPGPGGAAVATPKPGSAAVATPQPGGAAVDTPPPASAAVGAAAPHPASAADERRAASAIPAPLTALIGRTDELRAIEDQLARARVVTLLGPGGAGKTRLATEAARALPDPVLVELAPAGPAEMLPAILSATGREMRRETTAEVVSTRERVLESLAGRDAVLVLDNCEHVVDEVAGIVADLLGALPRLRVLATSREPLGVPGEAFVPLGPLPHPQISELGSEDAAPAAAPTSSLADLASYPAVELFVERATAATGVPFRDILAAGRICARLDGLPLALELAAAKLRTLTTDEVLAGLDRRFALLTGGSRTAMPRHRTLAAMVDWSWDLIDDAERRALSWLAVYPAGVDASDAGAFVLSLPGDELRDPGGRRDAAAVVLDALVDRSLLQRVRGRYRALETIRDYGIERLTQAGELRAARDAQALRMARAAAHHDARLRTAAIHDAIAWFDAEEDNLAAALRHATSAPLPAVAVDLALACAWYWIIRDRSEDARAWFPPIAQLAGEVEGPAARIFALLGPLASMLGDERERDRDRDRERERALGRAGTGGPGAEAHLGATSPRELTATGSPSPLLDPGAVFRERLLEASAEIGEVTGDDGGNDILQAMPPVIGAFIVAFAEDDWMSRLHIPTGEQLGLRPWPTATLHVVAAAIAQNRGDAEELGERSALAVAQFSEIGDIWGLALAQQMRAEWLVLAGRLDEALAMTDASTHNMSRITSSWDLAQQQGLAIDVLTRLGRWDEARERVDAMLAAAERQGSTRALMVAHSTAAQLHVRAGDAESARLHVAAIGDVAADFGEALQQFTAMLGVHEAGIALLEGADAAAEQHLHRASAAAVASHDQPIMGSVALAAGMLALARGDVARALEAVDVAAVLMGARDATHPHVVAVDRAAAERGIGRASSALTRPMAIEALARLT